MRLRGRSFAARRRMPAESRLPERHILDGAVGELKLHMLVLTPGLRPEKFGVTITSAGCAEFTVAVDRFVLSKPFCWETVTAVTAADWLDELLTVMV